MVIVIHNKTRIINIIIQRMISRQRDMYVYIYIYIYVTHKQAARRPRGTAAPAPQRGDPPGAMI